MSEIDTLKAIALETRARPKPYSDLRPGLFDIRFCYDLLSDPSLESLDDVEHRAFMRLVQYSAANRVWTYTNPGDGSFPDMEIPLARLLRLTPNKWKKIKSNFIKFGLIRVDGGRIHLARSFHVLETPGAERPAMPPTLRMEILTRDKFTCGYCGARDGPFDVDHVVPIIRGGANTEDNLICACVPCNRSKGGKTVEEWLS